MATTACESREARIRRLSERYRHAHLPEPGVNPWQYSTRRASYPSDPNHVDWRDPDRQYWTRLHFAVRAGDLGAVKQLIETRGANPWVLSVPRQSPMELALEWGQWEIARYLAARMDRILAECFEYERQTGRQLGLRSRRRRRPRPVTGHRSVTVRPRELDYVERVYAREHGSLDTISDDFRSSPYHY